MQCGIKENSKLILTADYGFGFKEIGEKNMRYKISLSNNNFTLTSSKIEEKKVVSIPLPPPPPPLLPIV